MKIGKTRIALASALSEKLTALKGEAIEINPEDLWWNRGANSHMTEDLARWGIIKEVRRGLWIDLHSWDIMTDCVRFGFDLTESQYGSDKGDLCAVSKTTLREKQSSIISKMMIDES